MKRLFSKKSGFTVVEIVMAFLIFAIMAGMILAVLRLAVEQRRSNNEFANELDSQTEKLVQKDKEKKSSAYDDGTISLDFQGDKPTNIAIDYATAGVTDGGTEDGINYFIGKYNNTKGNELTNGNSSGNGKAVNKRVESRIYGSTGFKEIRLYKIERDPLYTGKGVKYMIECSAGNKKKLNDAGNETADNAFNNELTPYRQYILFFKGSYDVYTDKDSEVKSGIAQSGQWKFEDGKIVRDPYSEQKILEAGYVEGTLFKNAKTTSAPLSQNKFSVNNVGDSSVLISIPKGASESENDFESYMHTYLYVVFENDPFILEENVNSTDSLSYDKKKIAFSYFGENLVMESSGAYAIFTSESSDTLVNAGKTVKERCDNIYGVLDVPVEEDPDEDSET